MTRFCLVLLVVGLVCIVVVAGCGDGSPTATVTPEHALNLPTVTEARLHGPVGFHCGDFDTWRDANDVFRAAGGPERDPYRLDLDADGIPCEALREQKPDG